MRRFVAKVSLIFSALFTAQALFCAPLNNDFTKANPSTQKVQTKESSRLQDQEFRGQDKEFKSTQYVPKESAIKMEDKRAPSTNSAVGTNFQSKKFDASKSYNPPDLKILQNQYSDKDKTYNSDNLQRDLNKDYAGSIDLKKKNPNNEYMKEFLEHTQEKSMQEINKYMFRSSHSSDPGIKTLQAGSEIHSGDNDSSEVADFLFGTKRVSGSPVRFKKTKNVGTVSAKNSTEQPSQNKQTEQSARPAFAENVKILPPVVNGEKNSVSRQNPRENKVKVAETEVDMGKTNLFAPRAQGMSTGKYKIKVEVSDPQ